ncbi:MAG: glycosyltransferase family 4 protein [Thermoflexales bacterium]|nr:glycosyltransferase family 4 protein [Thermoflexales bacterium]
MRIVLNGWFIDQPHTGSGQYLRQLCQQLPRVAPQHEYALIVPHRNSFEVIDLDAHTDLQSPISNYRKVLFEQDLVPRAARAYRADLIHVPYWAPPLRSPVPIVVTIHDIIPLVLKEYRGGPLVRAYTGLISAAVQGATLILTDSVVSRNDIISRLNISAERVRTIYLAVEPKFTDRVDPIDYAALRKNHDLPEDYVLYLGGFDARKNIEAALQTYTWAQDALGESFPLVIAGNLPDRHDGFFHDPRVIAKQIEVENVVRFIGPVAEDDKVALYQQARAFLYPSIYEGFGLPALEALACGVPVVGSNASSIPEIVGDAGMLVDPHDARAMAGALIAVCTEDALHDELSARALTQAAKFSWEKCARETVAAYEAVTSEK